MMIAQRCKRGPTRALLSEEPFEARADAAFLEEADVRDLCEVAHSYRLESPQMLLRLARIAVTAADRVGDPAGIAHSHAVLGNGLRIVGEYAAAEKEFGAAWAALLGMEEADRELLAMLAEVRAFLLSDTGHYGRALESLDQALLVREALGEPAGIAKVLVQAGIVRAYNGEPQDSMRHLGRALALIDKDEDLLRCAILAMAWVLVDLGEHREAHRLFVASEGLLRSGSAQFRAKAAWAEARIFAALGFRSAARLRFAAARDYFAAVGMRQEAGLLAVEVVKIDAQADPAGALAELESSTSHFVDDAARRAANVLETGVLTVQHLRSLATSIANGRPHLSFG